MINGPIETGTEEGWRVIDAAVRCSAGRLGDGLLSAYAIGSLAHGGFRSAVSDVDLALLTDDQRDRGMPQIAVTIASEVTAAGHQLADRLSIFYAPWAAFSDPPPDARFPPIDRYDLVRYGILVHGTDLRPTYATAPTADQVRAHAVESALRCVTPVQLAADLRRLAGAGVTVHDATKIVLWLVRLQHVCDTGQATGNAAAVDHYLQLPDARHRSLAHDALQWRDLAADQTPSAALERITNEIYDLHAEVFQRLRNRPKARVWRPKAEVSRACSGRCGTPKSPWRESLAGGVRAPAEWRPRKGVDRGDHACGLRIGGERLTAGVRVGGLPTASSRGFSFPGRPNDAGVVLAAHWCSRQEGA